MRKIYFHYIVFFFCISHTFVYNQVLYLCNDVQIKHTDKEIDTYFTKYSHFNFDTNPYTLKYSDIMIEMLCTGYKQNDSAKIALGAFLLGKIETQNPYKKYKEQLLKISYETKEYLNINSQYYLLKELAEHYRINHNFTKAFYVAEEMKTAAQKAGVKNPEAHYLLVKAKIYSFLEDTDKAKSCLNTVISNYPNFEDMSSVYFEMASILKTENYYFKHAIKNTSQPKNPIPFYNKAISLTTNHHDENKIYNDIGYYYSLQRQVDSAMYYYDKVHFEKDTLYYDYIYYLLGKGSVYRLKKNYPKSKEYFEKALQYSKKYQYKRLQYMSSMSLLTVSVDDYKKIMNVVVEIDSAHLGLLRYSEEKELFYQIQDSLSKNQLKISQLNLEKQKKQNEIRKYITLISVIGVLLLTALLIGYIYRQSSRKTQRTNKILKLKQRELLNANKELNKLNTRLEQFSSIAAHDMKNSIASIDGIASYLGAKNTQLDKEDVEFIKYINTESKKLSDFIDYLLYNAKQSKKEEYEKSTVDLNIVLEEVKNTLKLQIQKLDAQIISHQLFSIQASYFSIYQLFLNMIDNALKYHNPHNKEQVQIEIITEKKDNGIVIYFKDNGKGMTEEEKEKATEVYYQLIHHKDVKKGIGLGLHICAQIVKEYNGSITIESEVGVGSTICVYLKTEVFE